MTFADKVPYILRHSSQIYSNVRSIIIQPPSYILQKQQTNYAEPVYFSYISSASLNKTQFSSTTV